MRAEANSVEDLIRIVLVLDHQQRSANVLVQVVDGAAVLSADIVRASGVGIWLPERVRWTLDELVGVRHFFGGEVEWAPLNGRHSVRVPRHEPPCLRHGLHGSVGHFRRQEICIKKRAEAPCTAPSQQDLFGITEPIFRLQVVQDTLKVQVSIEPQAPRLSRGGSSRAGVHVAGTIWHIDTMSVVEVWVDL